MKCEKCGGKGYLETWYHYADRTRPLLRQCCDIRAYSRRVQLLNSSVEESIKRLGREEPFIGEVMTLTGKGLEVKGPHERREGSPCSVIPLRRS